MTHRRSLVGCMLLVSACNSGTDGGEITSETRSLESHGRLRVLIHDQPTVAADEVWLEIDEVSAHNDELGWLVVDDSLQSFDLLTLQNGAVKQLGLATLPAGHYTQLRLHIVDSWVMEDDTRRDFTIPSGEQTGLKLIHPFEVPKCGELSLILDWDPSTLVHDKGGTRASAHPTVFIDEDVAAGTCCTADQECDDGDVCNGAETCNEGSCVGSSPLDCNDGFDCTTDTCDPILGCVNTRVNCSECSNNGTICERDSDCWHCSDHGDSCSSDNDCQSCSNDGNRCNVNASCGGVCSTDGSPCAYDSSCRQCVDGDNDGDPCTTDAQCVGGSCSGRGRCLLFECQSIAFCDDAAVCEVP